MPEQPRREHTGPHGRVYSPPYRTSALGAPAKLISALDSSDRIGVYLRYVTAYGLGYAVSRQAELTLPGYSGPVELEHVKVPNG